MSLLYLKWIDVNLIIFSKPQTMMSHRTKSIEATCTAHRTQIQLWCLHVRSPPIIYSNRVYSKIDYIYHVSKMSIIDNRGYTRLIAFSYVKNVPRNVHSIKRGQRYTDSACGSWCRCSSSGMIAKYGMFFH